MLIPYLMDHLRHVSPPSPQYPDVLLAYSSFQSDGVQKRVPPIKNHTMMTFSDA